MTNDTDEFIKPSDLVFSRYQINLETQMKGIDFIFNCVNLSYYKCHKINFKHSGLYISSYIDWMKKKKEII